MIRQMPGETRTVALELGGKVTQSTLVAAAGPATATEATSSSQAPTVCVLVPTRNEEGNVVSLVKRVVAAVKGLDAELLFVDDSDDGTAGVIRSAAGDALIPVRLVHRPAAERHGGLGGAVLAGMAKTRADWVVVMDGDLQHPPEVIPRLLDAARARDLDLVVASRYCLNGNSCGLTTGFRRWVSSAASVAAKLLFPRRLYEITDPMSGFFAVRAAAVRTSQLRPRGFKILLEIVARSPRLRIGEVPFTFTARQTGHSKASSREAFRYLLQLGILRVSGTSTANRLLRFGIVGASGLVVNLLVLRQLLTIPLLPPGAAQQSICATVATQLALMWNFILTERWVFAGQARSGTLMGRGALFGALGNGSLLVQLPLAAVVAATTHATYLQSTAIVLLGLVMLRFTLLDRLLYCRAGRREVADRSRTDRTRTQTSTTDARFGRADDANQVRS